MFQGGLSWLRCADSPGTLVRASSEAATKRITERTRSLLTRGAAYSGEDMLVVRGSSFVLPKPYHFLSFRMKQASFGTTLQCLQEKEKSLGREPPRPENERIGLSALLGALGRAAQLTQALLRICRYAPSQAVGAAPVRGGELA